jgi:hypothetical protein
MIKWGTCGQHIWGTCGQFQKVFGNTINFKLLQYRLNKKLYLTVDPMSTSHLASFFFNSYVDINFNILCGTK